MTDLTQHERDQIETILKRRANEIAQFHHEFRQNNGSARFKLFDLSPFSVPKEIKFWYFYVVARMRGIGRAYNISPQGNSISCGIYKISEIRTMYFKHRWIPYCITRKSSSFSCR